MDKKSIPDCPFVVPRALMLMSVPLMAKLEQPWLYGGES